MRVAGVEILDMEKIDISTAAIVVLQCKLHRGQCQCSWVEAVENETMTLRYWNTGINFCRSSVAEDINRGIWKHCQAHKRIKCKHCASLNDDHAQAARAEH